jgi:riboflavin-specific deaminase-like protein
VTVKYAQTLDGRIATRTGQSKWISGEPARRFAHQLRGEHDAIMVGIGTVLADDPQLTVRMVDGRDPLRVIADSRLRIPLTARVIAGGAARGTIIACGDHADSLRESEIQMLGARVIRIPAAEAGVLDLDVLLEVLAGLGVGSVLVEGGSQIITWLMKKRLFDRLVIAVAPMIVGLGVDAVGNLGIGDIRDAIRFSKVETHALGEDVLIDARF